MLKGLLYCGTCGTGMAHTYTKKGNRLYWYYVCATAQKQGRDACPTPSLPAQEIEDFVVEQIRKLANDPEIIEQVYAEVEKQRQVQIRRLKAEQKRLQRERQHKQERIRELAAAIGDSNGPLTTLTTGLTELESILDQIDGRLSQASQEIAALQKASNDHSDLETALAMFGPVWEMLYPAEKMRIAKELIESIRYESGSNGVPLTLRSNIPPRHSA